MIKDLADVSYYQGIYDDYVLLGNGDLMIGFNLFFPELWTGDEDKLLKIHESLVGFIRKLPDNTSAHFQVPTFENEYVADYKEANNIIELEDLKSWDQRPVVKTYQRLYVTLSNEVVNRVSEIGNAFIRSSQYVLKRPFKNVDELHDKFKHTINTVSKFLEQNRYVRATRMDSKELLSCIHDFNNQCYDKEVSEGNYVNSDISFENSQLKIGNDYVAVVSLRKEGETLYTAMESMVDKNPYTDTDLPDHVRLPSSMPFQLTIGIPFAHIYNVCIEKVDSETAFSELQSKKRSIRLLATAGNGKAVRQRDEIGGLKDNSGEILSNGFIDQVERDGFVVTRCKVNVIIKDPSFDLLSDKVEYVINAFNTLNDSTAAVETGHAANLFFASAPGCMRFNYRSLWHVSNQSVHYILKETLYKSDREGLRFLDRSGCPITINNWKNRHIVNRNAVIFAPSGSGKSVLINHMVNQYVGTGDYYVIIIDVGGSFKKNTIINGGYYFDAGVSDNLQFNIFLCEKDEKGNYKYQPDDDDDEESKDEPARKDDQINFVASILLRIWKGDDQVSKETKAALKKSIVHFYEVVNKQKKFPTLKLYHAFLDKFKDKAGEKLMKYFDIDGFRLVLEEYVTGQYSKLLNSTENIKLSDEKYLVFDLEAIKENPDISEIVIAIIMHYASEIVYTKKGRKVYIVDEAIDYLKGDMGDFIAGLYRKIRKKNGQAIIATQGIGYLEELNALTKKSIYGNAETVWLLDHGGDTGSYQLLKDNLSLTEGHMKMLSSVGKGEGYREVLLKMGTTYSNVVRVQVSPFALAAYSTEADEVDEMEKLYKKSKNHITAIRDFLELSEN